MKIVFPVFKYCVFPNEAPPPLGFLLNLKAENNFKHLLNRPSPSENSQESF